MRSLPEIVLCTNNLRVLQVGEDGFAGLLKALEKHPLRFICSWGGGWEHVSISLEKRCPTWQEVCYCKKVFWLDEEVVVQYHPRKSEYVNAHPFCLHLWRPTVVSMPTPPAIMVGPLESSRTCNPTPIGAKNS